jgi:alpha-N-acetylglucosaminidase
MHLLIFLGWAAWAIVAGVAQSTNGILALVSRRLPDHVDDFTFSLQGNVSGLASSATKAANDEYTISSTYEGKIAVEGNSLIALASG